MKEQTEKIKWQEIYTALENVFTQNPNSKIFLLFNPNIQNQDNLKLYLAFFRSNISQTTLLSTEQQVNIFKSHMKILLNDQNNIKEFFVSFNNKKISILIQINYQGNSFDFSAIKKIFYNRIADNYQTMICQ